MVDPIRICLSMIVKDEARVLTRCLAAARPALDALSVCDTGSRDGTPEVVEAFAQAHGLPCEVPRHAWQDFGANRSRALEEARGMVRRLGWDAQRTYVLLLDADQVLEGAAGIAREALEADAYALEQRTGTEQYWNVRLVRLPHAIRYVGATHEYLELAPGSRRQRLVGPVVRDHDDGGSRADKFERDRRLLEAQLARAPGDARTLFYLARTYRALGERLKALACFRRRVEAGGWTEEVWHAWLASAQILREGGEEREARRCLLAARRLDRARAEADHLLAVIHREQGRQARAAAAARRASRRALPSDRALFLDRSVYVWRAREELALTAPGTRQREAGFEALEGLLLDRDVPAATKHHVQAALTTYARAWPDVRWQALTPTLPAPYAACNPCVIREAEGYLVNVRAVNYRQRDARTYEFPGAAERIVRTRNLLVSLDGDLRPVRETPLHGAPPPPRRTSIEGFEDLRLLRVGGRLGAVATTADRHPSGHVGPSWLWIGADGAIEGHAPLTGHGCTRAEKNWLPFLDERGEPRLLYALEPVTVLAFDPDSGACRVVAERRLPLDLGRWRGGGGPIPWRQEGPAGWLALEHEVAWIEGWRRRYLHRFVAWDAAGRRWWASRPFFFRTLGVEFAAGLCWTHAGDELLVSVGVEDREAWLGRLPAAAVQAALRPLAV